MSDTYDAVEKFVEETQRKGGSSAKRSDDKDHPQQDMGDGYYSKPDISQYHNPEDEGV